MGWNKVYVSLGGNIGDTGSLLREALNRMAALPRVKQIISSQFYDTSPVSFIPQASYVNAVCSFMTTLPSSELLTALQQIEKELGKQAKTKEEPRKIDLDILFYGEEYREDPEFQLPHPRWHERLFVLVPLLELTFTVIVPNKKGSSLVDLCELAKQFNNIHNETVRLKYA